MRGAGGNVVNNSNYLNRYKQSLLAKQQELLTANGGKLVLAPAGGLPGADFMDQAMAESEATIDAHLSQVRSHLRQSVEWALLRIQKGNYGVCATCGSRISRARLRAIPWTHLCRDCSEQEDNQF
jgi:DnaK suppressor protein